MVEVVAGLSGRLGHEAARSRLCGLVGCFAACFKPLLDLGPAVAQLAAYAVPRGCCAGLVKPVDDVLIDPEPLGEFAKTQPFADRLGASRIELGLGRRNRR